MIFKQWEIKLKQLRKKVDNAKMLIRNSSVVPNVSSRNYAEEPEWFTRDDAKGKLQPSFALDRTFISEYHPRLSSTRNSKK